MCAPSTAQEPAGKILALVRREVVALAVAGPTTKILRGGGEIDGEVEGEREEEEGG